MMELLVVARGLGISAESIDTWRRQDRIDRGVEPGLSSAENAELAAAKRRIAQLEAELAIHRCASELVGKVVPPERICEAVVLMAGEGLSVRLATRVLGVSELGYYGARDRRLSARPIRHAWLAACSGETFAFGAQ